MKERKEEENKGIRSSYKIEIHLQTEMEKILRLNDSEIKEKLALHWLKNKFL